jgi:D-tyrosyl-tRNA(Tyr) deacylase
MRVVLQRVTSASVKIEDKYVAKIDKGLLVLLGIATDDTQEDINWLVKKIVSLRIFSDSNQKMNLSVNDINGEIIVVSQFTLFASTKKGNRPSYTKSARPEIAIPLYHNFIETLQNNFSKEIQTGEFGADMKVNLINDGPVTIIIDSKNRL